MPTYKGIEQIGYFSKSYTQYVDKRLPTMPHAQCGIVFKNNNTILMSYTTPVAYIIGNEYLVIECMCSRTTCRHISEFVRYYTGYDYSVAKYCFEHNAHLDIEKGYAIHNETGEILKTFERRKK